MQAPEIRPEGEGEDDEVVHSRSQEAEIEEAPRWKSYTKRLTSAIMEYIEEIPEFKRLSEIRQMGWDNPEGDRFFEKQRTTADTDDPNTAKRFHQLMVHSARFMHQHTGVFQIRNSPFHQPYILDMCMASGGFLGKAMEVNPEAQALAFTLPPSEEGHGVLLSPSDRLTTHFLDITMLAEDIGFPLADIPSTHPDSAKFLPRHFDLEQRFDLAIYDGQVRRTQVREQYREKREAARLTLSQLIMSLEKAPFMNNS